MKIALCGFEGVGKSYLTEILGKRGFFKVKESARSLIALKNMGFNDRNILSMTALTNNLKAIDFIYDNKIEKVVFDRSILDDLIYLDIYGGQNLTLETFQKIINAYNKKNSSNYIYDKLVLLEHSSDDDYILNNVLNDDNRIYGKAIDQYKIASEIWESRFVQLFEKLEGLSREFQVVKSYPENKNVLEDVLKF